MDLSVVIPCRNEAANLRQQLDALSNQSWDGTWEVVVADNGSDDETVAIASNHVGLQGRLRVVDASDVKGAAYARRRGVESSSAGALLFCDGDDVVAPGWVSAMGNALREHDLVTGEVEVHLLNGPALAASRGKEHPGVAPTFRSVVFLRGNNGGMTRRVWDELHGMAEGFLAHEDIEFSLRAAAKGIYVEFVPEAVVHYRYRAGWRALWSQGLFYGASNPRLSRRCRELGLTSPARSNGWRSWAWLVLNLPRAPMRSVRYRWVWTLACRLGSLRGTLGRS